MKQISKEWLSFLREQYPEGSRIRLNSMEDPFAPVEPGTMGTLQCIDDIGTFHVNWDNGRTLGIIPGVDSFSLVAPEPTVIKLYMPLTADLYTKDDWGDVSGEPVELAGSSLRQYEGAILKALINNRMPEESESGIMHWYGKGDSVDSKVKSVVFTVEDRDGALWGVAECRVVGELTPEELDTLKDYISGQASDGWGEGFEQHKINVEEGELYVHLWNFSDWTIQTEGERFDRKLAEGLPEMCFSTLKSTGELICLKRGVLGYFPSEWSTSDKEQNVTLAHELNFKLGVTPAQRWAMEIGSIAGWSVPGADPASYEQGRVFNERLPKYCYTTHPDDGSLTIICRGENFFYPTDKGTSDRSENEQRADRLNDELGLTFAEVKAMNIGILVGWDDKGADPQTWENHSMNDAGGMTLA